MLLSMKLKFGFFPIYSRTLLLHLNHYIFTGSFLKQCKLHQNYTDYIHISIEDECMDV
jgi:hypothetical protein